MAKYYLDGTGILSGEHDSDAIERRIEEDRRKELAAAQREAGQEATKNQIEAVMLDYLRAAIAEELAEQKKQKAGASKRDREDFLRFREYCKGLDLPALPAPPQAVAAFINSEIDKGRAHVRRLIKSISTTHHKADLPDPTSDLLVRALLRLAVEQPPQPSN
jgi:hypothetical protein